MDGEVERFQHTRSFVKEARIEGVEERVLTSHPPETRDRLKDLMDDFYETPRNPQFIAAKYGLRMKGRRSLGHVVEHQLLRYWADSPPEMKERYPISELTIDKPLSSRLKELYPKEKPPAKPPVIPESTQLANKIRRAADDQEIQQLLDQAGPHFYNWNNRHKELAVVLTLGELLEEAGLDTKHNSRLKNQYVKTLQQAGLPVGVAEIKLKSGPREGEVMKYYLFAKKHKQRALEILREHS